MLLIQLSIFFLCINCYFEGDLPKANPAWETAQSRKGDHLASPTGSRRPQTDNY